MKRGAIVFDFDGTLADSEDALMQIYKDFAAKTCRPNLTKKQYYKFKKGSAKDVMRWAGVRFWQLPGLLKLGRQEYKKHSKDIKLFSDIPEVVKSLAVDYDLFILSSNSQSTVKEILDNNGLKTKITILKGSPLFRKDKALKKLLKAQGYDPAQSWMIGDEVRDVEAGKKVKMNTIGVSWGLQSEQGIKRVQPNSIARDPMAILKIIKSA